MDIQKKVDELCAKHSCNVLPIIFKESEDSEEIVGFIKEPSRMVKLRMLDKSMTGSMTASAEVFESILLKEDSDSRFSSEKSCDDKYYLGGVIEAFKTIEISVNTFKKK